MALAMGLALTFDRGRFALAGQVKITKALALRLLKEAVEKKGSDYIDPAAKSGNGCNYAHGTRPGCIVGHVLYAAGVKPKELADLDRHSGVIQLAAPQLMRFHGIEITPAALRTLAHAQNRQDNGRTWGEALTAARRA